MTCPEDPLVEQVAARLRGVVRWTPVIEIARIAVEVARPLIEAPLVAERARLRVALERIAENGFCIEWTYGAVIVPEGYRCPQCLADDALSGGAL